VSEVEAGTGKSTQVLDLKDKTILPSHIYDLESRPPGRGVNGFTGTITDIKYARNTVQLWIEVMGKTLVAELPYYLFEKMDLAVGKEVFLILRMRSIRVYENDGS